MFAQQARFLLNDENITPRAQSVPLAALQAPSPLNIGSPVSVPASPRAQPHKPRMSGIGRAPSRRSGGSSASAGGSASHGAGGGGGGGGGVHGLKPYARSASNSVTRAKHSANKASKASKARKAAPPPIQIPPADAEAAGSSSSNNNTMQPARPAGSKLTQIPLRLPRPVFPPVYCKMPGLRGVPSQYIVDKLTPLLPSFLVTCAMFRPMPELNPAIPSDGDPRPRTMTFGVPELMYGDDNEDMRRRMAGREPDLCLAVCGKNGGPAQLIPVNQVVYASQCAHWPKIFLGQPASGVAMAGVRPSRETSVHASDSTSVLERIEEEIMGEDLDAQDSAAFSAVDPDAMDEDACLTTPPPPPSPAVIPTEDGPTRRPGDLITLPILHVPVPCPDEFMLIHKHLYLPMRSLIPQLLMLNNSSTPRCPPPGQIYEELRVLEMPDLRDRLQHIHAVWKNLSALGFGTERTWHDMGEAWAHLVSIVALKEASPPPPAPRLPMPRP